MENTSKWSTIIIRAIIACVTFALLTATSPLWRTVHAQTIRIIFLHHSVGHNLIEEGGVRQRLTSLGYEFYDHGYNGDGLRSADGTYTGTHFDVPGDNTDPEGFAAIFAQPLHSPPDNTFSHLMEHDVIIFKSCYPTSHITSLNQLITYQSFYLSIRERMDQFPDKLFIIVTPPPEVPGESYLDAAIWARTFANWLQSDEYLSEHENILVFDFFNLLAGEDNFLRGEYRYDNYDGHPNGRANREIGPIFAQFIDEAIRAFEDGAPRPTPMNTETSEAEIQPEPTGEDSEYASKPSIPGLLDDFEKVNDYWEGDSDDTGSTLTCTIGTDMAHSGQGSIEIQFQITAGGWGGCWRSFEGVQDWSKGTGLTLWLKSEQPSQWVNLDVLLGDLQDPTPFIARIEIPSTEWTEISVPWANFQRASWASEIGPQTFDPTQVVSYGFGLGSEEAQLENTLWIDEINLSTRIVAPLEEVQPTEEAVQVIPTVEDVVPEEPVIEDTEEESGSSLCPFSTAALPLVAIILLRKRRALAN